MKKTAAVIAGLALLGAASSTAQASEIIFETSPRDQRFVYFAERDYLFAEAAFPFSLLPEAFTVTDAHWWGGCYDLATTDPGSPLSGTGSQTCPDGDFVLTFYDDAGGAPGLPIQSFNVGNADQTATGNLIGGFITEYAYTADFAPLVLVPLQTYWFAISNDVAGTTWGWESAGGEGVHAQFNQDTATWTEQNDNLAFRLTGPEPVAVPEPGMISLLAAGLGGLVLSRFRQHRH